MANKASFEKLIDKRLTEINDQLDFVYGEMQECLNVPGSDHDAKNKAMKDYDIYLSEYKDLLSCQIMIAKNYSEIIGAGKNSEHKTTVRKQKTTLQKMRDKRG